MRDCANCVYYKPMHDDPDTRSCSKWECEYLSVDIAAKKAKILDGLISRLRVRAASEAQSGDKFADARVSGIQIAMNEIQHTLDEVENK